jgi:hypothetical protein
VLVYLILIGTGIGLFGAPNMSSIMGAIPPERRGVAAGFRTVMMNVGYTMSLNLAVLVMTFTLPLALITKIMGSISAFYVSEADILLFVQGLKNTYVWLAVLDAIAIIPSVLRGKRASKPPLSPREALTEV